MNNSNILLYCLMSIILSSCGGMNDNIEQYLGKGEDIYIGRLDSVVARGGLNKIQIEGLTTFSHMATKCIIKWNEQEREFNMKEIVKNDTVKILLTDLPEGTYEFIVQTEDKEGNRSIPVDCIGVSYGDIYKSSKAQKKIISMDLNSTGIKLEWNLSELAVSVDFSYENTKGEIIRSVLPGDVLNTEITDWKLGGKMEMVTYIKPSHSALELLKLDPVTGYFPTDIK